MITRTVVEFDRHEREVLATAGRSLGIAFPQIHEPAPPGNIKRPVDQRVPRYIIAMGDGRAQETWSHEQVADAIGVMATQIVTLERESSLDYWLDTHPHALEPSDDPTSGYQQYRTLAEIRGNQLTDAREALKILMTALDRTASPESLAG